MLAIGSDHAGYELKCEVKKFLDGLESNISTAAVTERERITPTLQKRPARKSKAESATRAF